MLKYIVPTVCGEWYNQCTQAECLSIGITVSGR